VKLLESTQGKGVVLAETRKAANALVDAFRGLNAHFLVQEFVKEANGSDLRCFVVDGAGVDILRSDTGPKILEVNSSPGLQGIEQATGLDIANFIIECIENNVRTVFRTKNTKAAK